MPARRARADVSEGYRLIIERPRVRIPPGAIAELRRGRQGDKGNRE